MADDIDWSRIFGGAGGGASAGASVGSFFSPLGGLIGAGVGALGGGLTSLFGELGAEDYDTIYNNLMSKYNQSDEYKETQRALAALQAQTVEGPTAQEHAALKLALESTNQSFNNKYGSIRNELMARQGIGGNTNAALAAAQGQGTSNTMSDMALKAASEESARRERFIPIEAQARVAALQMQNQYQRWASGEAYKRRAEQRTAFAENQAAGMQGIASVGRLLAPAKETPSSEAFKPRGPGPSGFEQNSSQQGGTVDRLFDRAMPETHDFSSLWGSPAPAAASSPTSYSSPSTAGGWKLPKGWDTDSPGWGYGNAR